MHEVGMCEGVVAAVERRAAGRPVARVGVKVGARLRVVPEAFQMSFELVAAGGVADGATAELTVLPTRGRCLACGGTFDTHDSIPACPTCGGVAIETTGGDELELEWITFRDQDH